MSSAAAGANTAMPQFHFHVALRSDLFEDQDGCSYFDVASAKVYGRRLALDLARSANFSGATVLVVDWLGKEVARLPVGNVVVFPRDRHVSSRGHGPRQVHPDQVRASIPSGGD